MKLAIGQTGTLKNEILTVVSSNDKFFTCDNGKTYVTEFSKWMTDGVLIAVKAKRAKKYNACPEGFYSDEAAKGIDFEAIQARSRMNQRGSSLR